MTTAPDSLIKRIASQMPELTEVPLFGNAPPFDWKLFGSQIASKFGIPKFDLAAKEQAFKEGNAITKGLGQHFFTLPVVVTPLGAVFWLMSEQDFIKLTTFMMKPSSKAHTLTSDIMQEGFYRFLALEALSTLQEMAPFEKLTLQIAEDEMVLESAYCIDIEIGMDGKNCLGRLCIPKIFRSSWVEHFSQMPSEYVSTPLSRATMLTLGVKTGSCSLSQEEFKSLNVGDFVLLDKESYDAHKGTGVCSLMLKETPLFNAKIKQNKIEILDYGQYYEDDMETALEDSTSEEIENVAIKDLKLNVTVEIARLKISLDELMHLSPGNMLEIPIHPDNQVSLTINGQKVGRAELIHLGEQLGIRILEIH